MFGRHFRRHGHGPWREAEEAGRDQRGFEGRGGPHEGEFPHGHHGRWREDAERGFEQNGGQHHHGPHFGGWRGHARAWFGPEDRDRNRFFGRGGPFGGRGPFGGDPSDEDGGGRQRHRRGDIKFVLLELLAEQPRHGYELIKEIEQRYAGFYRPSPGSVYPTLQLLEEAGQLTSEQSDGKRVYTITEAGQQVLALHQSYGEPEGGRGGRRGFRRGGAAPEMEQLGRSVMALFAGMKQLAQNGTPEQIRAATTVFDTARRELYAILAQAGEEKPE
jgi:DNA-binding PadR family transcriptional regulator